MKLLAQQSLGTIGGDGLGPFATNPDAHSAISRIISSIIGVMTIAAGVWFLLQFSVGGFNWINAGGDKAKLQAARDKLTNAFVGLLVVVAGWAILALAGTFFGVDFTLTDGLPAGLSPN